MSPRNETPEPWRKAMEDAGMYSLNDLGRRTEIATSTVAALVYGRRKSDESTIQGVARALRLPVTTIRGWASVALGEIGPWVPPAEAARLNKRQRKALTELIRAMTADAAVTPAVRPPSAAGTDDGADDLAQDDFTLAARRGPSEGQRLRRQQDEDAES